MSNKNVRKKKLKKNKNIFFEDIFLEDDEEPTIVKKKIIKSPKLIKKTSNIEPQFLKSHLSKPIKILPVNTELHLEKERSMNSNENLIESLRVLPMSIDLYLEKEISMNSKRNLIKSLRVLPISVDLYLEKERSMNSKINPIESLRVLPPSSQETKEEDEIKLKSIIKSFFSRPNQELLNNEMEYIIKEENNFNKILEGILPTENGTYNEWLITNDLKNLKSGDWPPGTDFLIKKKIIENLVK